MLVTPGTCEFPDLVDRTLVPCLDSCNENEALFYVCLFFCFFLYFLYTSFHVYLPASCDAASVFYLLSFYKWWVVYKGWGDSLNKTPWSVIGSQLFPFPRSVCPSHKICSCWLQGLSPVPVLPLHHTVSVTFLLNQTYSDSQMFHWSGLAAAAAISQLLT